MRGFLEGGLSAEPLNLLEIDSASGQVDSGIRGSAEALVFYKQRRPDRDSGFLFVSARWIRTRGFYYVKALTARQIKTVAV
jgi:hypothetical protein